jgi:hypothetical protein
MSQPRVGVAATLPGTALTRGSSQHGRGVGPHQLHQVVRVGEVGVGVAAAKVFQRHAVADAVRLGSEVVAEQGARIRARHGVQRIKDE